MLIRPAAPERARPSRPRTRPAESGRELETTGEQDFGPDPKSGSGKFETPNRSAFVARRQSFWSVRGKGMGMSAWQRLKSFSGQNRSTPGTSNRQERGSHDAQPRDSSSKNSQAPPADHPTYRHRMIETVPRQHAAQRAAVRSCRGQGQLCSMPGRGWHAARFVLTWPNRLVRCYWFCCARAMGEWSPPINQQEEIGMEATVEAPSAQTTPSQVSHRAAPPAITAWCLDRSGARG